MIYTSLSILTKLPKMLAIQKYHTDKRTFYASVRRIFVPCLGLILFCAATSNAHPDLSVIDPANSDTTAIIDETTTNNDTRNNAMNLDEHFSFENDQTISVVVEGSLSDNSDIDYYSLSISPGGKLELKFNLLDISYQTITALAADPDSLPFVITDNNTLWEQTLDGPKLRASASQLAQLIPGVDQNDLIISDIAISSDNVAIMTFDGRAEVITVDSQDNITLALSTSAVNGLTGLQNAQLVSVAVAGDGTVFLSDVGSNSVLAASLEENGTLSNLHFFVSPEKFDEVLPAQYIEQIHDGLANLPFTFMGRTDAEEFPATSLVPIFGSDLYEDGFYVTQFSISLGGQGGITRIVPNEIDPDSAIFSIFFDPDPAASVGEGSGLTENQLNPTALALATPNNIGFENKLYMGGFGPDMGNAFDGLVFQVQEDGSISQFVTEYKDSNGDPAVFSGLNVTGFFDVIDLAFSPGGLSPFGDYLYVLSENIDDNGPNVPGGFSSDLWRIDSDGVAHLFIPSIREGVGSMAFDTVGNFGGDLFVSIWMRNGDIHRVDSDGNLTFFYRFDESQMILDMAFAPANSIFNGALLATIDTDNGKSAKLVSFNPDGSQVTLWSNGLKTGMVPSGDIIFDDDGNLYILLENDKGVIRIDYQPLQNANVTIEDLDATLGDIQIRPQDSTPYILIDMADQPRIVSLGANGDIDEITTAMVPSDLDVGDVPLDGSKNIVYTFQENGDIIFFIQNTALGQLRSSTRDEDTGRFSQFNKMQEIGFLGFEMFIDMFDIRLSHLAWLSDGTLLGNLTNGSEPPHDPPNQILDDKVFQLYNTIEEDDRPITYLHIDQFNRMPITVEGPDDFTRSFDPNASEIMEQSLDDLEEGTYYISVNSRNGTSGNYQLMASVQSDPTTIIITGEDPPIILHNSNGDQLVFDLTGPGRAEFFVERTPAGNIINIVSLTITGTNSRSSLDIKNIDNPQNLSLGNIILTSSMSGLSCKGSVDNLTSSGNKYFTVKKIALGDVNNINLPRCRIDKFWANNLGDPNAEDQLQFNVRSIKNVDIRGDINNVRFFNPDHHNNYKEITIKGILDKVTFYGDSIRSLTVQNSNNEDNALNQCGIFMAKHINHLTVKQGNVVDCTFSATKSINHLELSDGNLEGTDITANSQSAGAIGNLEILNSTSEDAGNIINCLIRAGKSIKKICASGIIDEDTNISATGVLGSKISKIISGGNCAASINAFRVDSILIGFDPNSRPLPEDDDFKGSDFTGSVNAALGLKYLSATGSIDNAVISSSFSSIGSLLAQDGFDARVTAGNRIDRIMVGFINGRISKIANPNADVQGSISARNLGRLYYTGTRNIIDSDMPSRHGPITQVLMPPNN